MIEAHERADQRRLGERVEALQVSIRPRARREMKLNLSRAPAGGAMLRTPFRRRSSMLLEFLRSGRKKAYLRESRRRRGLNRRRSKEERSLYVSERESVVRGAGGSWVRSGCGRGRRGKGTAKMTRQNLPGEESRKPVGKQSRVHVILNYVIRYTGNTPHQSHHRERIKPCRNGADRVGAPAISTGPSGRAATGVTR